jgi:hypothetical protein
VLLASRNEGLPSYPAAEQVKQPCEPAPRPPLGIGPSRPVHDSTKKPASILCAGTADCSFLYLAFAYGGVPGTGDLGGGPQGDLVAEGLELTDAVALGAFFVLLRKLGPAERVEVLWRPRNRS